MNLLEIPAIDRELAETDSCDIEHHVSPETLKKPGTVCGICP